MKTANKRALLAASAVAGLLAVGVATTAAAADEAKSEKVKCYGVNKCKGTGACATTRHACSGKNACKGQGFLEMDKQACLKMKNGRLSPVH